MKKNLSRLFKLPVEYYVVFFLFALVIFISIYGMGGGGDNIRPASSYENFESAYTESAHSAAAVTGKEVSVLQDTNGVLGLFEADGIKASPLQALSLSDPVSGLKGSPSCVGISNGLSNSLGGLCLSPEVKTQFATRGGNMSSGNFQIG
jgi:hypothetical protein